MPAKKKPVITIGIGMHRGKAVTITKIKNDEDKVKAKLPDGRVIIVDKSILVTE